MDKLEALLEKHGPMLSGRLAKIYESKYGVSNIVARKSISRAQKPVTRLNCLFFDKGQLFYYLESQYMGKKYCDRLFEALLDNNTYKTFLKALLNQSGGISKKLLAAYTSSPVKNVKGHKLYSNVLVELRKINVIDELDDNYWKINDRFYELNYARMKAIEYSKQIILNDFCKWVGKINFGAYGSGKIMNENPDVANFQWGCTIPSYTQPLYDEKQQSPGFIIADIITGKKADLDDVQFFLQKLKIIKKFKNLGNLLPVLFVDSIYEDAFKELKDQKVIIGIIENFFDKKYADLVSDLVNVYTNATAILLNNPAQINDMFHRINQLEGRFNNARGSLFEFIVGYFYQKLGCNYLEINKLIYSSTRAFKEVDVMADRDGTIIVVECKANKTKLNSDYVEKWLNENIPFIRDNLNDIYSGKHYEFQLWSISGFDDSALKMLEYACSSVKKYSIRYFNREDMIKMAEDYNITEFIKVMNEHFIFRDI
jgi:hypothetical protein